MAHTEQITDRAHSFGPMHVAMVRLAIVVAVLGAWESLARSGLLYRDVVPPLLEIGRALAALLSSGEFYGHLGWTALEVATAVAIGTATGIVVGIAVGGNRFLTRAFEPYLYYLGATPKLIFFPVMIMWFGIGPSSKIALGVVSCFFPVALSTLGGMREINHVLIDVGRSFRATAWQMTQKIYLPAMRAPILNGMRLGLGIAVVVTLLAETKLSNRGIGYLVIQAFNLFDMPGMYALLIAVFATSIGANALLSRLEKA